MQIPNLVVSRQIYEEFKFWGPFIGGIWAVVKAYDYSKSYLTDVKTSLGDIKNNHLAHIQSGIENFHTFLDKGLEKQTREIVTANTSNTKEIKELRDDIRTLTTTLLVKG